jgi:type I restriction enzyme M protein
MLYTRNDIKINPVNSSPEAEPVIAKHQKMEALDFAILFPDQILPAGTKPVELEGLLGLHPTARANTSNSNPTRP